MNKDKKQELINAAKLYLVAKYGASFLRMNKEKQNALILNTITNAIKNNSHGV